MAAITNVSIFNSLFSVREETKLQAGWKVQLLVYSSLHCWKQTAGAALSSWGFLNTDIKCATAQPSGWQRPIREYITITLIFARRHTLYVKLHCRWCTAATWGDRSLPPPFWCLLLCLVYFHYLLYGKALCSFFQSPVNPRMLLQLSREPSRPNKTVIIYERNRPLPPDSLWQNYVETYFPSSGENLSHCFFNYIWGVWSFPAQTSTTVYGLEFHWLATKRWHKKSKKNPQNPEGCRFNSDRNIEWASLEGQKSVMVYWTACSNLTSHHQHPRGCSRLFFIVNWFWLIISAFVTTTTKKKNTVEKCRFSSCSNAAPGSANIWSESSPEHMKST